MVEIVEEPEDNQPQSGGAGPSNARPPPAPGASVSAFVRENTMECVLFASRVMTVFFAVNFLLPFVGWVNYESAYYKVFIASAATFALRLHTRVSGTFALNAGFFQRLMSEDAFHYLIYSVLFIMSAPVTMALLPVTIYAFLHATTFLAKMLRATGHNSPIVGKIENFNSAQLQNALGIIACSEIFLVPLLVSLIFSGKSSLFLPFAYYRFLTLRYASRRNASTRQAFYQMRVSLENVASSASCPQIVRTFIHKTVAFLSSRAPPVM